MTSDKPDMLIDRAEAERLIKQAQYDRAEFMRGNIKHVIWAMGSIGTLYALGLAVLSVSAHLH
jgi:hypothetical protein